MDWETLYCPNRCCPYYGVRFRQSQMVKNGRSHVQPQALCRSCGRSVALSHATAYEYLESEPLINDPVPLPRSDPLKNCPNYCPQEDCEATIPHHLLSVEHSNLP